MKKEASFKPRSFWFQKQLDRLGHFLPWALLILLLMSGAAGQQNVALIILIALMGSWVYKGMIQGRTLSGLVEVTMRLDRLEMQLENAEFGQENQTHNRLTKTVATEKQIRELKWLEGRLMYLMQRWPIRYDTRWRLHHRLARVALLKGDFELVRYIVSTLKKEELAEQPIELPVAGNVRNMIQMQQKQQQVLAQELGADGMSPVSEGVQMGSLLFLDENDRKRDIKLSPYELYLPISQSCGKNPEALLRHHLTFMWIEASLALSDPMNTFYGLQDLIGAADQISLEEQLRQMVLQQRYQTLVGQDQLSLHQLESKLSLSELLPPRWVGAYLNELSEAALRLNQTDLSQWLASKAALVGINRD